jgi:hypothetical protein
MRVLKSWSSDDVENGRMLDVRVGDPPAHWLIFAGIAKPEWNIDDSDILRDDVLIDLGVDVTQMLNYTATTALATVGNRSKRSKTVRIADGRPVMSGSTSSGPGPNCEIDVMGHKQPPALQRRSQQVGPPARCNPFPCDPDRDTLPA